MNIGIYISPAHAVPPNENNILAPWMLVADLADGLAAKKHNVTLFAAHGSKTDAKLVHGGINPTVREQSSFGDQESYKRVVVAQELLLFREVIAKAKAGELDVIHVHQPVERLYPALASLPPQIPVVITFHDPILPTRFPAIGSLFALGNIHFVSLSHSQQHGVPFPFAGVVPNGVDTAIFRPDDVVSGSRSNRRKDARPLLITGRIVPEKGFSDAIVASQQTHHRLMMVGEVYEAKKESRDYFFHDIKPLIDKKEVLWEPVVKRDHLIGHYQTSKALLFPIHWEEPFGLVMIEAMACGMPVIAYDRGSVGEILVDGKTGFIIKDDDNGEKTNHVPARTIQQSGVAGIVEAISRLAEIRPDACRQHVLRHFTTQHMVEGYEAVYRKVTKSKKRKNHR